MRRLFLCAALAVLASTVTASAPAEALTRAREQLVAGEDDLTALGKAVLTLSAAEASAEPEVLQPLQKVRAAYEALKESLSTPVSDRKKLEKALKKAQDKLKAAEAVDDDDKLLESKADKLERETKVAKAKAAAEKATAAVKAADKLAQATKPRTLLLEGLLQQLTQGLSGQMQLSVLSDAPMVLVVDGWLGAEGSKALGELQGLVDAVINPANASAAQPPIVPLPTEEKDLSAEGGESPQLCLPLGEDGELTAGPLAKVQAQIDAAKKAHAAGEEGVVGSPHPNRDAVLPTTPPTAESQPLHAVT